jgi:uncharacterized protein (DUF1684 family)
MEIFRTFIHSFFLIAASLVLSTGISANNTSGEGHEAWLQSIHESWTREDNEFKNSPTSPLAGVSRFEISETGPVYFANEGSGIEWSLEETGHAVFSILNSGDQWVWTELGKIVQLSRKDKNMPSGIALKTGDQLTTGRLTVVFYPSADAITTLVFDPDTQRLKDFKTLDRFEANPAFALTATIERFETPEQLELITGRQQFKKQYRYGKLHFEIDGTKLELTAYKHSLEGEGSYGLFIPFTDKTSGRYTYGGGRYLMVKEPAEGDEVFIDFNLVTNPLCSYADIYNCIVPTPENRLSVAILVGVKKYH